MTDGPGSQDDQAGRDAKKIVIQPDPDGPDYRVDPVPKVPRGIGWRWAFSDVIRIVFLAGLLAAVLIARNPCSSSVATFVDTFDEIDGPGDHDTGPAADDPRGMKLERLTEEQIRQRFQAGDPGPGAKDANQR